MCISKKFRMISELFPKKNFPFPNIYKKFFENQKIGFPNFGNRKIRFSEIRKIQKTPFLKISKNHL